MIKLAEALDNGDQVGAERIAHTIKGTAATLGADHLSEMARELEEKLHRQFTSPLRSDDIRTDMDNINQAFKALARAMPHKQVAAPDNTTFNPETVKIVLHELDTLLAQCDTAAIKLLEGNAAMLAKALGSSFEKLSDQIKGFEFEKARETLKGMG